MPGRLSDSLKRALSEQRGQALPEFALVLPLLFMILFGILDFGRALNYWLDETHLANEAARYAAVNPDDATLCSRIRNQIDTKELSQGSGAGFGVSGPATIAVAFNPPADTVTDRYGSVTVTVSAGYNWMPILNLAPVTIVGRSTMRLERAPQGGPPC